MDRSTLARDWCTQEGTAFNLSEYVPSRAYNYVYGSPAADKRERAQPRYIDEAAAIEYAVECMKSTLEEDGKNAQTTVLLNVSRLAKAGKLELQLNPSETESRVETTPGTFEPTAKVMAAGLLDANTLSRIWNAAKKPTSSAFRRAFDDHPLASNLILLLRTKIQQASADACLLHSSIAAMFWRFKGFGLYKSYNPLIETWHANAEMLETFLHASEVATGLRNNADAATTHSRARRRFDRLADFVSHAALSVAAAAVKYRATIFAAMRFTPRPVVNAMDAFEAAPSYATATVLLSSMHDHGHGNGEVAFIEL